MVKTNKINRKKTPKTQGSLLKLQKSKSKLIIDKQKIRRQARKKFIKTTVSSQKIKNFQQRLINNELQEMITQSKYSCSICLEIVVVPSLMECGHLYCLKCIELNTIYSLKCCNCRYQQDNPLVQHSTATERIIERIVLPQSDNAIQYLCRVADFISWNKRRMIDHHTIKISDDVDFRDQRNIWKKGTISNIYINKQGTKMIQISLVKKGEEPTFETVQATSRKIATYTFFTKYRYLIPNEKATFEERDIPDIQAPRDITESMESFEESLGQIENDLVDRSTRGSVQYFATEVQPFGSFQHEESNDAQLRLFNFEMEYNNDIFF